jgi:hypothetical protein
MRYITPTSDFGVLFTMHRIQAKTHLHSYMLPPGITSRDQRVGVGAEEDRDNDIAIARERISIKCPLTLQEFKDPVTSKKYPHTFKKLAILNII